MPVETCDIPTRIVHYYKLAERKDFLVRNLTQFSDVVFVEFENLPADAQKNLYSGGNAAEWTRKVAGLWTSPPPYRPLFPSEVMTANSHFHALSTCDAEWVLVLEDDAVFGEHFAAEVNAIVRRVDPSIDVIFLGGGFPRARVTKDLDRIGDFVICAPPNTNCAVSYLIRKRCRDRLMAGLTHFDTPIDFELAYQFAKLDARVAHVDPYIVREGSKFTYTSEVDRLRRAGVSLPGRAFRFLKRKLTLSRSH